jgi:hypothetical protein
MDEQLPELRGERRVRLGFLVLDSNFVHGDDQRLRDERAAVELGARTTALDRSCCSRAFADLRGATTPEPTVYTAETSRVTAASRMVSA